MNCIINKLEYDLSEIEKLGWNQYVDKFMLEFPQKLYKYFPNTTTNILDTNGNLDKQVNFSQISLIENTIFMQNPEEFDDPFDTNIFTDNVTFISLRLKYYLTKANIKFNDFDTIENLTYLLSIELHKLFSPDLAWFTYKEKLKFLFKAENDDSSDSLNIQLFIEIMVAKLQNNAEWDSAIWYAINHESNHMLNPKKAFRISSFTTSPYLVRMWSTYANYHKGFCIEYDSSHYNPQDKVNNTIYHNTLPAIYTDDIVDTSEMQSRYLSTPGYTEQDMWDSFFHGLLRKSTLWKDQNEWRYILPSSRTRDIEKDKQGFSTPYLKISKVYIGKKMPMRQRKQLIELCNKLNIPYVGVTNNPKVYEMVDCQKNCEECINENT